MDPNEALKNAREALKRHRRSQEREEGSASPNTEGADDLADAFESLDRWLSKGGFLPDAWKPTRTGDGL